MSLRTRVVIVLLALFGSSSVLAFAIQYSVVYPRFLELESTQATKNVERAVEALQRELDLLIPSIYDWTVWDESYRFVQDRNQAFAQANLNTVALQSLAVNLLAFYDLDGERIWGGTADLSDEGVAEAAKLMPQHLPADHVLLASGRDEQASGRPRGPTEPALAGIYRSEHGPFLLVSKQVLNSAGEGPPKGRVLMARRVGEADVARLGAQARVDLSLSAPAPGAQPLAVTQEPGRLAQTPIGLTRSAHSLVGETTLMDIGGRPALTLRVTTPRAISARGREALWTSSLSLAVVGGLVMLTLVLLLRRIVLDPLSRLTAHASSLGAGDDLDLRLNIGRKDELGVLADAFDRMMERLAQARQRLLEQSYRAGVAEMASGVLHNLGNAVTPIGVKLTRLQGALREAPVEEVDLALAELAQPGADPDRRRDMQDFLQLAGQELAGLVRRLTRDLGEVQTQVEHVQQILVDQERFSRAERVMESVAVYPLLEETVRLLPDALRARAEIELDPGLRELRPVQASRVALQQIVSNLVINAAEAMPAPRQSGPPGRLHLSGAEELNGEVPMVHLRFADNGSGISAEALPRIFEPGFSTKSRGSGTGLHWTANSVRALGGRISAESAGVGLGACLHLCLRQAIDGQPPQQDPRE